jgi:tetratricopeptide (TPR) repeat protein
VRDCLRIAALCLVATAAGAAQTTGEAAVHLKAGADHLQRGEVARAIAELKSAVALQPESAAAHMLLGQAYVAQRSLGMVAEAKAEFQQALDIDPTLFWARFYLARVYMDLGRYDKAKQELEHGLKDRPNVPHFIALLGEVKRKLGDPEASLDLNGKALAIDPSLSPAHYHRALAYMDLKRDDDAIRELEAATGSQHVAPDMCLTLGSLYLKKRRYKEAEAIVGRGIELDPSRSEGYLNLAQLYNTQGRSDKALASLKQAMPPGKTFPTSPYYQQVQADISFERGRAYQAKKRAAEAIEAYSMSLSVDPSRAEAHRRLAEIYSERGDQGRAREHSLLADQVGAKKE